MTTWADVGKTIAPLAPTLGGILGGLIPIPGASLIGSAIGNVIAKQFGVEPTPEKVNEAILKTEADIAIARLNAATEEARVKVQGFVEAEKAYTDLMKASIEATNVTMRAEIGHEDFFYRGWRPACGWCFVFYAVIFGALLSIAAVRAAFFGDPAPMRVLVDAWPAFLAYLGPLALMVGVYVFARTSEKTSLIDQGKPPTPTGTTTTKTTSTVTKPPAVVTKPVVTRAVPPNSRYPTYDGEGRLLNP